MAGQFARSTGSQIIWIVFTYNTVSRMENICMNAR